MSTTDEYPFSVAQQKALISADLHSTLLFQFLFGIYTGIFLATMYIYSHKENRTRARDMIIIGNTGALYFLTALNTVMNWIYTNILFCTKEATRVDMSIESFTQDTPLGVQIIDDMMSWVVYLFADGLLVWRCFHACGQSFRRSLLPILLLAVETASAVLVLTTTVYHCLVDAKSDVNTIQNDEILYRLSAASNIAVVLTSLVSTGIICLQIWRHTSPSSRSWKHYKAIINALIQSSAIYTVTVLLDAIFDFTYAGNSNAQSFTSLLIVKFVDVAGQITSGLAPTLMIARLILSSSEEDTEVSSAHLPSELISRAPHATGTANMMNVGADLEMQQRSSFGVDEQESEEIQVVSRNEYHQPEDDGENRLKNIT
ncbi:hypothetical protein CPC08DRAFT_728453 [Agrocybe pediades]|nr:hypothetical protein CPC08DRAFT_728453 [Agrocybe pediades]